MEFQKKHIKHLLRQAAANHNLRIILAFLMSLITASLLIDFPIFSKPISDAAFSTQFARFLAWATGSLIEFTGYKVTIYQSSIMFTTDNGVFFDFACLGFREIIWFSSFMIVIYGPFKQKLWYIPVGIIMLQISNILRSFTIAITNFHRPESFDIIHAQGSLWFMYGTILILWLLWLNAFKTNDILTS